ncbi:MAG: hypothetical protein NC112_06845 [Oxalobacter formigenes]|nr:hypothetical protein [Oxalobacter formigenes]
MMGIFRQYYKSCFALLIAGFLVACSSTTNEILPLDMNSSWQIKPYVVKVQTEVTSYTNIGYRDIHNTHLISNDKFQLALEEAIIKNHLFKGIIKGQGKADYFLSVTIKHIFFPDEVEAIWTLKRLKDKKVIFQKAVLSWASNRNETFADGRRMTSITSAARENIRQGLTDIAKLDL